MREGGRGGEEKVGQHVYSLMDTSWIECCTIPTFLFFCRPEPVTPRRHGRDLSVGDLDTNTLASSGEKPIR